MPAEAVVDILDDLLAPLVLEIDVDIGRLVARVRDEALEQQVRAGGIDLGDAERIADGGIGGRAAPLVEDVLLAGIADDVLDGEEKRRVFEPRDQLELVLDLLYDHEGGRPGLGDSGASAPPRSAVRGALAGSRRWARSHRDIRRSAL